MFPAGFPKCQWLRLIIQLWKWWLHDRNCHPAICGTTDSRQSLCSCRILLGSHSSIRSAITTNYSWLCKPDRYDSCRVVHQLRYRCMAQSDTCSLSMCMSMTTHAIGLYACLHGGLRIMCLAIDGQDREFLCPYIVRSLTSHPLQTKKCTGRERDWRTRRVTAHYELGVAPACTKAHFPWLTGKEGAPTGAANRYVDLEMAVIVTMGLWEGLGSWFPVLHNCWQPEEEHWTNWDHAPYKCDNARSTLHETLPSVNKTLKMIPHRFPWRWSPTWWCSTMLLNNSTCCWSLQSDFSEYACRYQCSSSTVTP